MAKRTVGSFVVETGEVVVSDPCYEKGLKKKMPLPALNGEWVSHVNLNGENRVSSLVAVHKGTKRNGRGTWVAKGLRGVDSGQMSIFDAKHFRKEGDDSKITPTWREYIKYEDEKDGGGFFYATCCSLTCGEDNGVKSKAGVQAHGVVSQTGYGDGSYSFAIQENDKGEAVAIRIQFC